MATKTMYVLATEGTGRHTAPLTKKEGLRRLEGRAKNFPGPWDTRIRGKGDWKSKKALPKALDEFEWRLGLAEENDIVMLRSTSAGKIIHLREILVETGPPPGAGKDINGYSSATDNIQKLCDYIVDRGPGWVSWGICNCRRVAGSSTWSQHAWCNAIDVSWTSAAGKGFIDKLVADVKRDVPHLVSQIIWRDGAAHESHVHFSGAPYRNGTPPCA